ncbi:MAG: hypothetical protein ABJJ53_11905 [Sulfitobacter sp.]
MSIFQFRLSHLWFVLALLCGNTVCAAPLEAFAGAYVGEAEFVDNGQIKRRDMSTSIEKTKEGFTVSWTSVSYKEDGEKKAKSYSIEFIPSDRANIFKSAMGKNLFGQDTPLDPLKGEPFVWARLEGDTLSVFSLFINEVGEYEVQEFHRSLVEQGLELVFLRVHNGVAEKEIRTTLVRVR